MSRLDNIKTEGIAQALSREISSLIWEARDNLERASHECYKNFKPRIKKAKGLIAQIEETYTELAKVRKMK